MHFRQSENRGSARSIPRRQRSSALHLIVRVSSPKEISRNGIKPFLLIWSEWRDSNSRHPGPKPGALPAGPHPENCITSSDGCQNYPRWKANENYTRSILKKQLKKEKSFGCLNRQPKAYTLNRKLTISPSFITYSLPSLRTRPLLLAFAIVPHSFMS